MNNLNKYGGFLGLPQKKPMVSGLETIGFRRGNHWFPPQKPSVSKLKTRGNHRFPPQETAVLGQNRWFRTLRTMHKHGLFTYYLLRKIQETKADCTLGEIADYVKSEVFKKSIEMNGNPQTPTVAVSESLENTWRSKKLK